MSDKMFSGENAVLDLFNQLTTRDQVAASYGVYLELGRVMPAVGEAFYFAVKRVNSKTPKVLPRFSSTNRTGEKLVTFGENYYDGVADSDGLDHLQAVLKFIQDHKDHPLHKKFAEFFV